jgi:hypothetical protein
LGAKPHARPFSSYSAAACGGDPVVRRIGSTRTSATSASWSCQLRAITPGGLSWLHEDSCDRKESHPVRSVVGKAQYNCHPPTEDGVVQRKTPAGHTNRGEVCLPCRRDDQTQQLGLTSERDRAGGIGKTGWSNAGKRLGSFFIGRLLIPHRRNRESSHPTSETSLANLSRKSTTIFMRVLGRVQEACGECTGSCPSRSADAT